MLGGWLAFLGFRVPPSWKGLDTLQMAIEARRRGVAAALGSGSNGASASNGSGNGSGSRGGSNKLTDLYQELGYAVGVAHRWGAGPGALGPGGGGGCT